MFSTPMAMLSPLLRVSEVNLFFVRLNNSFALSSSFLLQQQQKQQQQAYTSLRVCNSFRDAVGQTPLLRLSVPSQLTKCNIYAKCEFLNPGGSVKDRVAVAILEKAEQEGKQ